MHHCNAIMTLDVFLHALLAFLKSTRSVGGPSSTGAILSPVELHPFPVDAYTRNHAAHIELVGSRINTSRIITADRNLPPSSLPLVSESRLLAPAVCVS